MRDELREILEKGLRGEDVSSELSVLSAADARVLRTQLEARSGESEATLHIGSGAGEALSSGAAAPQTLGRYELIRELGRGGQGQVYLAWDSHLGRKVALKLLRTAFTPEPEMVLRFQREAEAASRLDHPGVCAIYESGELDGHLFIAMRYVEGDPLSHRIAAAQGLRAAGEAEVSLELSSEAGDESPGSSNGTPDPRRRARDSERLIVELIEDVARTTHFAHETGIIHRDLKPANVMVTPAGDPVILDFGLARDESSELPTLTETGDVFGTPHYMSPEQIEGERVDRRTDVWALGVMLYECLTLARPFDGPTRDVLCDRIRNREASDPQAFNPSLHADLRVVLATALEKDTNRRYQTALDLAEDLRRVRLREPILARPASLGLRLRRWVERNPVVAASSAIILLVLLGALSVTTAFWRSAERERRRSETLLRNYERLADAQLLEGQVAAADALWPARPERIGEMEKWLAEAEELARGLPLHQEYLEVLRRRALPYTSEDENAEFRRGLEDNPEVTHELATLLRRRKSLDSEAESDRIELRREQIDERIADLKAEVTVRRHWEFAIPADAWKHENLSALVHDLEGFVDPDPAVGMIASVRQRRDRARRLAAGRSEALGKRWDEAVTAIADRARSPQYGGLVIPPQLGLVPLGPDPASGQWEFADTQTGRIPVRDRESRRLSIDESSALVFVLLPGGRFGMGSSLTPDEVGSLEPGGAEWRTYQEEIPVTEVELDPFFISKYELTRGQWKRFNATHPHPSADLKTFPTVLVGDQEPAGAVSWRDGAAALRRLGFAHPTEAQWEYAARGGTETRWWTGDTPESLEGAANLADRFARAHGGPPDATYEMWLDDGCLLLAPVDSYAANPFGLHAVVGNLSEWCRDMYAPYENTPRPGDGLRSVQPLVRERVSRGGSYQSSATRARSAARWNHREDLALDGCGLRPVRVLER